jgi:hypothetical protein
MTKHRDVPWGTLITYPPVGFWMPGLPRDFVRKAWKTMNPGGKRALEEYCVRRWPSAIGLSAREVNAMLRCRKTTLDDGLVLEQRAKEILEQQGYFVARCLPFQPVIDLVAFDIRPDRDGMARIGRLIQVKAGRSVPVDQRVQLLRLAKSLAPSLSVEVWSFHRNPLQPDIKILGPNGTGPVTREGSGVSKTDTTGTA